MIRSMDLPPNIAMTRRSLLRWFALAFGLLSAKESRNTVIDVLDALFSFQLAQKKEPTTNELQLYLKEKKKPISDKLLRYHLKRMIDVGMLQRRKMKYSFSHSPYAEKSDLIEGFRHNIKEPINKSLDDIEAVLGKIKSNYSQ